MIGQPPNRVRPGAAAPTAGERCDVALRSRATGEAECLPNVHGRESALTRSGNCRPALTWTSRAQKRTTRRWRLNAHVTRRRRRVDASLSRNARGLDVTHEDEKLREQRQRSILPEGYTPPDAPLRRAIDYAMDPPPPGPNMEDVAKRLWSVFGGGENPALRRQLFERLEREVEQHGTRAYRVIESCVKSAVTARNPDRYFCGAVVRRLREAGMMSDASEKESF